MRDYCAKHLRPLIASDVEYVTSRLRHADQEEIFAKHGRGTNLRRLIELAVTMTPEPETFTIPGTGEPIAVLGVVPPTLLGGRGGVPWMVGTDKMFGFARPLVHGGRQFVRENLSRYGKLENVVDSRNIVSVRWLKVIGFTLEPAFPVGPYDVPFHRFHAGGGRLIEAV